MRLIAFTILIVASATLAGLGALGSQRAIGLWMLFFSVILLLLELTIQRFWIQAREAVIETGRYFTAKEPDGLCPKCQYDLRGNPAAATCPECGETIPAMPK